MGRRGPLPKDPEKLLGHRRRAPRPTPGPRPDAAGQPEPRAEWREDTRASWRAYWASDLALLALEVDSPAIARLFAMYDQHARSMEAVSQALVVRGSTGQIRANPLADHALRLESAIVRLENELGLTPAARTRMGIAIRRPVPQPSGAPVMKPGRYEHLREVAS
ncbi:MAG TPA: P27 family phage terminase small subunit [Candidatus Limnocylindrales bacterium]|nr:P27 family phage terminase small subunit [Candidatus Limnocylindrales bacterium]